MKKSQLKGAKNKNTPKTRTKVSFRVKLSPKKKEKEVFNPFGLDLSSNV